MKETDIAERVINYLTDLRWDVYQEVQFETYGRCADIVATQGPVLWIIECKTSAGLAVINQAYGWVGAANMVSVAVPKITTRVFNRICIKFGIGVITVDKQIFDWVRPALSRRSTADMRAVLSIEHKTYAKAGNSKSSRWTPFQSTCINILATVQRSPGISMKDLVKTTQTHYSCPSTARTCLARWIRKGVVPGVMLKKEGRFLRIYPETKEN